MSPTSIGSSKRSSSRSFDHRFINREIPHFRDHYPTLEAMLLYMWGNLSGALPGATLSSIRLMEGSDLWATAEQRNAEELPMVSVTRVYEFAAAHRLNSSELSEEENQAVYGKCNRPHGHGT